MCEGAAGYEAVASVEEPALYEEVASVEEPAWYEELASVEEAAGYEEVASVEEVAMWKGLTGCKSVSRVDSGCHNSLVVGMLTLAPVQQLGRGERADPGVSQLTLPNSDSIA